MIVGYGRARTTRDVDARIEYAKDEVLAAAEEIAAERNFATGSGSDPRVFGACQRQRPRSIPARLVVVPLDVALVDLDAVGVDVLRPAVVRHRGGVLDVEHDPPDFVRRPAGAPRRRTAGVALDPALNQADGSHPNETATVGLRSSRGRRQGTASTPRGARWPVGGAVPQRAGVAAPCAGGASIPASTTTALAPCAGRMIASGAAVIERMSPRRRPSLAPSASTTTCARHASAPATHPAASAAVAPARAVVVTSARTRSSPRTVRAPPGTPPRRRSRFPRPASRRSSAARVRRPRSPRSTGLSSPRASPICPAGATRSPRATSTRPGSPRRVRSGSPCRWRSCSRRPARGAPAATAGTPSASTPRPASTRAGRHHPVRPRACSATDACTVARQCASSWRPRTDPGRWRAPDPGRRARARCRPRLPSSPG